MPCVRPAVFFAYTAPMEGRCVRVFRRIAKIAGVVLAAALVNGLLVFALVPYGSRIGGKWQDCYEMESLDTVVIGTSLIEDAVNPAVLDAELGSTSVNLGTAKQMPDESYLGVRTILENRDISTVILSIDLPYYQTDKVSNPASTFLREKNSHEPLSTAIADDLFLFSNVNLVTSGDSVNWLFPYVYDHVTGTSKSIIANMRNKIVRDTRVQDLAARRSNMEPWQGQGYCSTDKECDFTQGGQSTYRELYEIRDLDGGKLDLVRKMCELCNDKGVQLIVIHPPLPRFQVLDYGDEWFDQIEQMRQLVEQHGAAFYDFDLVRTDLFSFDESFYRDMQHMNAAGARSFSKALATVLKARVEGEDCSRFFYSPDEYRASFEGVSYVRTESSQVDGGVQVTARAVVPEGQPVEYQFLARPKGEEEWVVAREYGEEPDFTYEMADRGTYELRINSRIAGSGADFEKFSRLEASV